MSSPLALGYSEQEIASVPAGVVCRGCGNPTALADLKPGEVVLDLGCGAGFDAFLAAGKVGPAGKVIAIDACVETVAKARQHAAEGNYRNVTFGVGQMTALPLENDSIDVVISNCVINYSVNLRSTFQAIFRCLKPGGRMLVADLVTEGPFSPDALSDPLWGKWLAGAAGRREYLGAIGQAGFVSVAVVAERPFDIAEQDERLRGKVFSIQVRAHKRRTGEG